MTWFKIDDKLHAHPKWWSLSPDAKALWTTAGAWSASYKTDGLIGTVQLEILAPQVGLSLGKTKKAAAELVEARMWVVEEGVGFRFHQWTEFNPLRATLEKDAAIEQERQRIQRDPELKAAIRARDGDLCRYCGCQVDFAARRGHYRGTYDHVIPVTKGGLSVLSNVVVACEFDNKRKYNKTLAEAEMTLLDPGTRASAAQPGFESDLIPIKTGARKRVGSGSGLDLVGNGPGLADTGLDDAGLDDHGSGQGGQAAPPPAAQPVPEHGTVVPTPVVLPFNQQDQGKQAG